MPALRQKRASCLVNGRREPYISGDGSPGGRSRRGGIVAAARLQAEPRDEIRRSVEFAMIISSPTDYR
jgi:hypothetical protein